MAFQTRNLLGQSLKAVYKSVYNTQKYGISNMDLWHLTHEINF
jgi:hypothetical protein